MKNKSVLIIAVFASILMFSLFNCKNNNHVINVIGENASNLKALESTKSVYEKANNIEIKFNAFTFEDAFNKSNQDFVNKTGLYDIVMQYNFSLSSFVRNNYIVPLNELTQDIPQKELSFENDLFDNAWEEIGYYYTNPEDPIEGITKVGYPFATNTMILAYNKDLFDNPKQKEKYILKYGEELAPPKTWNQYKQIAEFFTQPDNKLFGVCLQGSTGSWLYYEWCNFLFSMGGKVMDKKRGWEGGIHTPILLNSKEAKEAATFYKSLKPFNKGNFFTIGAYEQMNLMKEGDVAMVIMWSDLAYELIKKNDGQFDKRFGFVTIPGDISGLAGGSFFINRQSSNKADCINYIINVLQTENQIELIKIGLCSANKMAYEDSTVINTIPYSTALKESLARGVYMFEAGPDADLINNKITKYLQMIWNDEITVDEGMNLLNAEIEKERAILYKNL
jgi:multiple sugar transport system substrate-binding protein